MSIIASLNKHCFGCKRVFADFRGSVPVEGSETWIEEDKRMTAFGRRYLNALGEQDGAFV